LIEAKLVVHRPDRIFDAPAIRKVMAATEFRHV